VNLLEFTDSGIYCPKANVYLDPWKPVNKALITHGHSDHARWGNQYYLCTEGTKPIIQYRLNTQSPIQTVKYGETIFINGVRFSFYPAGHIVGSAQIKVEYNDDVWVFSGDYKLEDDGLSGVFDPIKCNTFVTESTFGLPIYKWKKQHEIFFDINAWWKDNIDEEKVSIIAGYSLGKAQRILMNLDQRLGKIFVHGGVENINNIIRAQGVSLPTTHLITKETARQDWQGAMIICPPSAIGSLWMRKFQPYSLGIASGWMSLRGTRRRRGADRGFALSDHADWDGLNTTIKETGASRIYVTHGYTDIFANWLKEQGIDGHSVKTQYEGELSEMADIPDDASAKQDASTEIGSGQSVLNLNADTFSE
jgi:putative mRNA 3-end processing factor